MFYRIKCRLTYGLGLHQMESCFCTLKLSNLPITLVDKIYGEVLLGRLLLGSLYRCCLWENLCQMCNKILIENWEPKLLFHLNSASPVDIFVIFMRLSLYLCYNLYVPKQYHVHKFQYVVKQTWEFSGKSRNFCFLVKIYAFSFLFRMLFGLFEKISYVSVKRHSHAWLYSLNTLVESSRLRVS